jgi:hypothetical protein
MKRSVITLLSVLLRAMYNDNNSSGSKFKATLELYVYNGRNTEQVWTGKHPVETIATDENGEVVYRSISHHPEIGAHELAFFKDALTLDKKVDLTKLKWSYIEY